MIETKSQNMIITTIELPENLGGKFQIIFSTEEQKAKFKHFIKFIDTLVIIDDVELTSRN